MLLNIPPRKKFSPVIFLTIFWNGLYSFYYEQGAVGENGGSGVTVMTLHKRAN